MYYLEETFTGQTFYKLTTVVLERVFGEFDDSLRKVFPFASVNF